MTTCHPLFQAPTPWTMDQETVAEQRGPATGVGVSMVQHFWDNSLSMVGQTPKNTVAFIDLSASLRLK